MIDADDIFIGITGGVLTTGALVVIYQLCRQYGVIALVTACVFLISTCFWLWCIK